MVLLVGCTKYAPSFFVRDPDIFSQGFTSVVKISQRPCQNDSGGSSSRMYSARNEQSVLLWEFIH